MNPLLNSFKQNIVAFKKTSFSKSESERPPHLGRRMSFPTEKVLSTAALKGTGVLSTRKRGSMTLPLCLTGLMTNKWRLAQQSNFLMPFVFFGFGST